MKKILRWVAIILGGYFCVFLTGVIWGMLDLPWLGRMSNIVNISLWVLFGAIIRWLTVGDIPAPLITSVPLTPDASARLVAPDGDVTISLDANSVDVPVQLTYTPLSVAEIPALPTDFTATGKAFDLTVETNLLKLITITVALSAADPRFAFGS